MKKPFVHVLAVIFMVMLLGASVGYKKAAAPAGGPGRDDQKSL